MRKALGAHCSLIALGLPWLALMAPNAAPAAPAKRLNPKASGELLVVGDSLSAEYGLQRGEGWVALMTQRLGAQAPGVKVINASISGDTTSGGRSRLPALLKQHQPRWVILELGGNDALRGLPLESTRANLASMARLCREAGASVLLVGMQMPPNYGQRYAKDFAQLFKTVAQAENAALLPFLLAGIAERPDAMSLFQADRIHPTAQAQAKMMDNVWEVLTDLL